MDYFRLEAIINDSGQSSISSYQDTTLPMWLAIRKVGANRSFLYSTDGISFTVQNTQTDTLIGLMNAGVFARDWGENAVTAPFDNFRVRMFVATEPTVTGGNSSVLDTGTYYCPGGHFVTNITTDAGGDVSSIECRPL